MHEYKVVCFESADYHLVPPGRVAVVDQWSEGMNQAGREGWTVVATAFDSNGRFVVTFERELR
ncbi:MAG: hypothetical protein LBK42_03415 [Propionibacteriaceae bacterium]|jgi:hypothetical protein|nr:hypothetical protein [Propionibacteriaceae bacterium]